MSLTGVPLIVVALLATALAATATVLLWSRHGRWRMLSRTVGVLLSEALLVLSVGLIANRSQQFYPSWDALAGRTGPVAAEVPRVAGRLDESLHTRGVATLAWRPPSVEGWHLAAGPSLVMPAGYVDRPTVTFPVVLDLGGAHPARDTVVVHLAPSERTSAASLASLPEDLSQDVRVSALGWALVAPLKDAVFAADLIRSSPGRFVALALVGDGPLPPVPVPVAVVRERRAGGAALPPGVTALTGTGRRSWTVAVTWAAGQTIPALAAPVQLPEAPGSSAKPRSRSALFSGGRGAGS